MGNGSPRLLTILRCSCVLALAALWYTPSAFAEDGALLSASVSAGPVQAAVAVPDPPAAAVQAPPAPATPATSTVPDAVVAASAAVVATVAPHEPQAPKTPVHVAPTAPASPSVVARTSRSLLEASAPARHSVHRGEPQSPRSRGHKPLPQGAGRTVGADAFPSAARRSAPRPALASTRDASPMPRPEPEQPLPRPFGLGGATSSTAGTAIGMLLFALAGALGFLKVPQLGRVLTPRVASPRPYHYLLRLERPD